MLQVNTLVAKTDLSKLMRMLETRQEDAILIARNGNPIVKMTAVNPEPVTHRIGVAKGAFTVPDEFDEWDVEVASMFEGSL